MYGLGVYILTDSKSGRFYVGSSQDVDKRILRHIKDLNNGNHHCLNFQTLWSPKAKFRIEFIPCESREEAYQIEDALLDEWKDDPRLLNIGKRAIGGDNFSRHPNVKTIRQRIEKSISQYHESLGPEGRRIKYGKSGSENGMYGRTHSVEARKKMSESASRPENLERFVSMTKAWNQTDKFKKLSSERAKLRTGERNTFYGKHHSEETKAKLRAGRLGKVSSPEQQREVEIDGRRYISLSNAARELKISPPLLMYRLKSEKPHYASYRYIS